MFAGQAPYNPPHDGPLGVNSRVSSQHILPFHHDTHSRSAMPPRMPSGTLTTILDNSHGPSMSESLYPSGRVAFSTPPVG